MGTEIVNSRFQTITTPPTIQGDPTEGLFTPTATQNYPLGTKLLGSMGRVWRYAKGTCATAAKVLQSEAVDAQCLNITQTGYTTSVGQTRIKALLTTGNDISDGELKDGWLVTVSGTGFLYSYPVKWNRWITSDTIMDIELYEPIRVATAATTVFTFVKNLYADFVIAATTLTGAIIGVNNVVFPAGYYGWIQTKGICPVTVDTAKTLVIGELAAFKSAGTTAAGCIDVMAATDPVIGRVITIATGDATALIDLQIE